MSAGRSQRPSRRERGIDVAIFVFLGICLVAGGLLSGGQSYRVYLSEFMTYVVTLIISAILGFGMFVPILRQRKGNQEAELNRLVWWSFRAFLVLITGTVLMAMNATFRATVLKTELVLDTSTTGYVVVIGCFLAWVSYYLMFFHKVKESD